MVVSSLRFDRPESTANRLARPNVPAGTRWSSSLRLQKRNNQDSVPVTDATRETTNRILELRRSIVCASTLKRTWIANSRSQILAFTLGLVRTIYKERSSKRSASPPCEYIQTRRLARMKLLLKNGHTVTKALYGAGFSSRSRFYGSSNQFGMSAGVFRRGGNGLRVSYSIVNCQLGRLLVAATPKGVCAVFMGDTDAVVESALSKEYPRADLYRTNSGLQKWVTAIMNYFAGQQANLNLPLDIQASTFQRRVWKEIQSIPYGSTSTYSQIASEMGQPNAARAVAKACATNPVSLVIPCHRVVGKNGDLRGYRWGEKRKKDLLALESSQQS